MSDKHRGKFQTPVSYAACQVTLGQILSHPNLSQGVVLRMKLKEGAGELSLGFHSELLGRTIPAMMVILNDPHRKWVLNGNPEGESGEKEEEEDILGCPSLEFRSSQGQPQASPASPQMEGAVKELSLM